MQKWLKNGQFLCKITVGLSLFRANAKAVSGERKGGQSVQKWPKNEQVLCKLVNNNRSGIVKKTNTMETYGLDQDCKRKQDMTMASKPR